jgi:molecular chaperone DnaJ
VPADYYALLGVDRNATEDEIKRAYRRLARELHPDARGGDPSSEERFKEVTRAYETLRDPERRRRYDMFGPEEAGAAAAGADPASFFGSGLGDIFESFFGGPSPFGRARPRSGPMRGPDAEAAIELEFEEAVFGAEKAVTTRGAVTCSTCAGSGARPGTGPVRCRDCGGSGELRRVRQSILGQIVTASPCPRCRGTGELVERPCPDCGGDGRRVEERTYAVEVPAGVDDGSTLRLAGRGPAGPRGGPPGDLYVHVRVRPHRRFRRAGYDLVHELHVGMTQAALGTQIDFDTLDGTEVLVIPAGTQTGRVFRLKHRGVPHVNSRARGDLVVQVVVDTPTGLDAEQEELLRRLAELRGEPVAPPEEGILSRIRSAFK